MLQNFSSKLTATKKSAKKLDFDIKASKLYHIGLSDLLEYWERRELISEQTEIVQKIYSASKRRGIKPALGESPGKRSPIQWINRLLSMVGLKLKLTTKKRIDGRRVRYYQIVGDYDNILRVDAYREKFAELDKVKDFKNYQKKEIKQN